MVYLQVYILKLFNFLNLVIKNQSILHLDSCSFVSTVEVMVEMRYKLKGVSCHLGHHIS